MAISKVKPILNNPADIDPDTTQEESHWQESINHTLVIIQLFQREKLQHIINELFASYPLETLASNYFQPINDSLDRQAKQRFGGRAEKVFFESEVRIYFLSRIHQANNNNTGDIILILVLDGHKNSINPLLLSVALLEAGLRLKLLLEACHLREIPYIVEQSTISTTKENSNDYCRAVVCHSDSKIDILNVEQELARSANHAHIPYFISGLTRYPARFLIRGIRSD